jgi:hypothetical protein
MVYHSIPTIFSRNEKGELRIGRFSDPVFRYLRNLPFDYTEKVDGMNTRVAFDGEEITFHGRTNNAQLPANLVNWLNSNITVDKMHEAFDADCTRVCLYGEGYGDGIQDRKYLDGEQKFILFDVYVHGYWLKRKDVEDVARKLGIDVVPIVGTGSLYDMVYYVRDGFKSLINPSVDAEGIVARPIEELFLRNRDRVIVKLKTSDFKKVECL